MRVWHFTEQSYTPGWTQTDGPIRISPPSEIIDPDVAHQLYRRYLDEWVAADELGLDIMVNEHHTTFSSISPSVMLQMAILARTTKRARLLCLGVPVVNRMDPFRVAEELALVDVISKGRLEFGLIKGVPWEAYSANMNPVRAMDRLWEAHDLIVKALTTTDGPFSWEGEYYQYRFVNVYPRCYQQPMPEMWMPTSGAGMGKTIGLRGYKVATFMVGYQAKNVFEGYREGYRETFGRPTPLDRLAYLGMAVVGHSEAQARERAEKMKVYLSTIPRVFPGTTNPPGYASVEDNVMALRSNRPKGPTMPDGRPFPANASIEDLANGGVLFWGTPDQVFEQIKTFNDGVGGFGNFLMEGQAANLSHQETVDSLSLFAKEVYPRLKELAAPEAADLEKA